MFGTDYDIRNIRLSSDYERRKVEDFLKSNDLKLDRLDYYAAITDEDENIIAGAGMSGDIIKDIAVDSNHRDEGLSGKLISHLIERSSSIGILSQKIFTKPENENIFSDMGFHTIAKSDKAILMENAIGGIDDYCRYLKQFSDTVSDIGENREYHNGVIVMNANPFTHGHRYLIEKAVERVDHLFIIPVKEDISEFSYQERKAMIEDGCRSLIREKKLTDNRIIIVDGSDYSISAATFPSYFLKKADDIALSQIRLDLYLYKNHIAKALKAEVRFVGSEPEDELTRMYNDEMKKVLGEEGVAEIERLKTDDFIVSASRVRNILTKGKLAKTLGMVPSSTLPYLLAHLASNALKEELNTENKPGLVDALQNGSHKDMNYALMMKSIETLHPFFIRLAKEATETNVVVEIGKEAENAMLAATGGVNTHRGALFALGISIVAAMKLIKNNGFIDVALLQKEIMNIAVDIPSAENTHGSEVKKKYKVGGALDNAKNGYRQLFESWLPFYIKTEDNIRTLLLIISQLTDTNILYRKGSGEAEDVKKEAKRLFDGFSNEGLLAMHRHFIERNISPGGAADMLALTIFIKSIIT